MAYLLVPRGESGIDGMRPEEAGPFRVGEERRSASVVGVDTVEFLDHPDGIVEYGLALRRDLALAVRRHRPQLVITLNHNLTLLSGGLNMADHRNVGLAVLDAVRDAGNRWVFTDAPTEAWDGVRIVLIAGSPGSTHGVDVTCHFEKGAASLAEHKAYLEALGITDGNQGLLRATAEEAGRQLGCDLGVLFELMHL